LVKSIYQAAMESKINLERSTIMRKEDVERIRPETLAHLIEKATPVQIVDIRNDQAYGESDQKIPGAIRATFDTLDEVMGKLDKEIEVVTYCT
jgi:rhodanese-related sulfurtransferase